MSYYAKGRRSEKPCSRRERRLKTSSIIMHPRKSSTIAFLVSVVDLKFNRFLFFFFVGRKPHYFFKEAANIKTQVLHPCATQST